MTPPSHATSAGRAYPDIQKRARADRRPVDEYLQFYVLECFLVRLSRSRYAKRYVLKGGALLAAFGERRQTLDIDFLAQGQASDPEAVLAAVLPHQPADPGGAPGLRAWLAQRITSVL
jgi:hypothetical protein